MKRIDHAVLEGKTVLVRIDANVPLNDQGIIQDDFRLRSILPTLRYILEKRARIILLSHLGRPGGRKIKKLSLEPVAKKIGDLLGRQVSFWKDFPSADQLDSLKEGEVALLENLRYQEGEESNSRTFARKLAKLGDIYINDAFAVSHRAAASLCAITEFLPSYVGLLLEKEINVLKGLLSHPAKPFIVLIGGKKVEDKLPVIKHLIEKADIILCSGVVANTFIKAIGAGDVKKGPFDRTYFEQARRIFKLSRGKIILPVDFVFQGSFAIDIGAETIRRFSGYLKGAKTILWNGCPGRYELSEGRNGSVVLAKVIAESLATSVIGGGNTVDLVNQLDLADRFSFISTGGGAMLEYLSGKKLPAISSLE